MTTNRPLASIEANPANPRSEAPVPTIIVKRLDSGEGYSCVVGELRLRAALSLAGAAHVVDADTGGPLVVHEVGEQLLVVTLDDDIKLQAAAIAVIGNAQEPPSATDSPEP